MASSSTSQIQSALHGGLGKDESRLKRLAHDYMTSYPGNDCAAKNHFVHGTCRRFLRDHKLVTPEVQERLMAAVLYRLQIQNTATEYKDWLGLDFPDCAECDVEGRVREMKKDKAQDKRYSEIWELVGKHDPFGGPVGAEGLPFIKGFRYLVVVLTGKGWSLGRVEGELKRLVEMKQATNRYDDVNGLELEKGGVMGPSV